MTERAPLDMRKLTDAVVASFQPLALAGGDWTSDELTLLTDLREKFLAAGAERLERLHNPARWLQVGVRFESGRQAVSFLRRGGGAIATWLSEGRAQRFFFMRKAPGLRLRFGGAVLDQELAPRLHTLLHDELAAGRLVSYENGVYDAETHQFGGELGLDIAHDLFTCDSLAIIELLRCRTPRAILPMLSLTVLNHLAAQLCEDSFERWDAWCNMRLVRQLPRRPGVSAATEASFAAQRQLLAQTVWEPDAVLALLDPAPRTVLARCFEHNLRLAGRLREVARSGQLLYGVRKIFPFYVIFHWNRWLISPRMQVTLTCLMQRLLDPKAG